jgi:hypothetical protein
LLKRASPPTNVVWLVEILIIVLIAGVTQGHTSYGSTWDIARYPDGSVGIGVATSGGGLWLYHGMYYIPGVGHVDYPLGKLLVETAGGGPLGYVAYSDFNGSRHEPDVGLVATGTKPIPAFVHVGDSWTNAAVEGYYTGTNDLPAGTTLCESGYSKPTDRHQGYRCGTLTEACNRSSIYCIFANPQGIVASGDSGGLVWSNDGGGVRIAGWVSSGFLDSQYPQLSDGSYTAGTFTPPWKVAHYAWAPAQSWHGGGGIAPFPSGNDGSGCFVSVNGCQSE